MDDAFERIDRAIRRAHRDLQINMISLMYADDDKPLANLQDMRTRLAAEGDEYYEDVIEGLCNGLQEMKEIFKCISGDLKHNVFGPFQDISTQAIKDYTDKYGIDLTSLAKQMSNERYEKAQEIDKKAMAGIGICNGYAMGLICSGSSGKPRTQSVKRRRHSKQRRKSGWMLWPRRIEEMGYDCFSGFCILGDVSQGALV